MNKLLLLTNALFIGIIIFLLFRSGPGPVCPPAKGTTATGAADTGCTWTTDYPNTVLAGTITARQLTDMSQAYKDDQRKSRISEQGGQDAMSIVFELERVKNLVWKIEHSVCESGCDTSVELGIRLYYIKYPENVSEVMPGVPAENSRKHAIAMVPVFKSNRDNLWYDFFILRKGEGSETCLFDSAGKVQNDPKFTIGMIGGDGTNHGGVAPPPGSGVFPTLNQ